MSEEGNFSAEGRNNFNVGEERERERKGKEGGREKERGSSAKDDRHRSSKESRR